MHVIYKDYYEELKIAVMKFAKYQKVMLLYDDSITNSEIKAISDSIKGECIFNQANINNIDRAQLYDGYRMLIFKCGVDSFLQAKIDTNEFVNFFFCPDENYLPYFALDIKQNENNYICLSQGKIDHCAVTSIYINRFYNYLNDIVINQQTSVNFDFNENEITQSKLISMLNDVNKDFDFVDLDILREMKIDYKLLPLVDYLLITAFQLIILASKSHSLNLVDIYKSSREDYEIIDKFYAMSKNQILPNVIELNFNIINIVCKKTKERICELLSLSRDYYDEVDELIYKIKNYCKNSNSILSYLYLYNIFSN